MLMKENQVRTNSDEEPISYTQIQIAQNTQPPSFMKKYRDYILIILATIAVLLLTYQVVFSPTRFFAYQDQLFDSSLVKLQIDQFRKLDENEIQEEKKEKNVGKGLHPITRQELGHNSWTLLHMITGTSPPRIDENLRQRFNTFLIMFGQFYPCKLCANHFLQLIQTQGLFKGETKRELMTYLCNLHNKVNKRLGKQQHSCQNIVQQWNTCGCNAAE